MIMIAMILIVLFVSPAFSEEEHRVEFVGEIQPDRAWGEYRDNIARIRLTRIPEPDGDIWLTDMTFTLLDPGPELPKFDNRIRLGLHVWAKECPPANKGLIGWTPEQDIYLSIRHDGVVFGKGEMVSLIHWSVGVGDGSKFGAEIDDLQYPILGKLMYLKVRASWWQKEGLNFQYGASLRYKEWQAYWLHGSTQTWGVRVTLPLASTSF
jgi:hypothetical protein